jgi:hypothetical protein
MMGNITIAIAQQRVSERIKDGTERRMRARARLSRGRRFTSSTPARLADCPRIE